MRISARHGLLPQERVVGNDFEVSVSVDIPVTDDDVMSESIDRSVSYASLADIVRSVMREPCDLLETVAARIRHAIVDAYPHVKGGVVEVRKLTPPIPSTRMESASVALRW